MLPSTAREPLHGKDEVAGKRRNELELTRVKSDSARMYVRVAFL
jgi:hypothetical protein